MDALTKYKPAGAAEPMARLLTDGISRGPAAKALKTLGPAAEDAVIPYVADDDIWTAAEACKILESIGTKKSLDALNKAAKHTHWMVNQSAARALKGIERRESVKPK